ncbi:hypothetical protein EYF80_048975 [Liparis tanakae]|uniref:Uncharacterized protein n=1 Tax=Liparis tanakae TaxID=230148 RepID=A0A4Z2FIW6_9TELE|nr:hypothetical protein EYF80_048975 [Liparis tanakae]
MHTFLQEMLGGVGRLQENVGVTLFLKDKEQGSDQLSVVPEAATCCLLIGEQRSSRLRGNRVDLHPRAAELELDRLSLTTERIIARELRLSSHSRGHTACC